MAQVKLLLQVTDSTHSQTSEVCEFTQQPPPQVQPPGWQGPWPPINDDIWHGVAGNTHIIITRNGMVIIYWIGGNYIMISLGDLLAWLFAATTD